MEARIRYLATVTERPRALAEFYTAYLGMRELGRSADGDISLTDGFYNLALLQQRPELGEQDQRLGHHHFGIAVRDLDELRARLEQYAPGTDLQRERGGLHFGEYRVPGPNGLPISISTSDFGVPAMERGLPAIRHVALSGPHNDEVLDFFVYVFGFRELSLSRQRRQEQRRSRFAGDGSTNLAILAEPESMREHGETRHLREGLNHFGFVVADMQGLLARLPGEAEAGKRPEIRQMVEFRASDPDGNGVDLSQHLGYEVDVDVWERAA
jgi:catechol 2,3-dioxygenase-like lactoylglutathione lyase family enzyme